MNSKFLVILWIIIFLVTWILTAYYLATLAVIAIEFQEIFIHNLTNSIVIGFALLCSTVITVVVYFVGSRR